VFVERVRLRPSQKSGEVVVLYRTVATAGRRERCVPLKAGFAGRALSARLFDIHVDVEKEGGKGTNTYE
jgi:hypothetical protein